MTSGSQRDRSRPVECAAGKYHQPDLHRHRDQYCAPITIARDDPTALPAQHGRQSQRQVMASQGGMAAIVAQITAAVGNTNLQLSIQPAIRCGLSTTVRRR